MVVADTQAHANAAALAVKGTYKSLGPLVLTIKEAIQAGTLLFTSTPIISGDGDPMDALKSSKHQISGEIFCGPQYHFYMETQRALVVPVEDGYDVVSSTQHVDHCQRSIAQVLGITESSVNVSVKRIGGGFGGKISNGQQISCGAALAASVVKRPVRVLMDIDSNMRMLGCRPSYLSEYQIGFDDDGKLNAVIVSVSGDCGFTANGDILFHYDVYFDNAYYCPHWKVISKACKTHTPSNTACRSPGSVPSIFAMESIMEHVAKTLGKTPEEVRVINLYQKGQITPYGQPLPYCSISSLWTQLITSSDFQTRSVAIQTFNKENRWKKKGLSVVPLKFGVILSGAPFTCVISAYAGDGSVAISTGGIEMGQGLNTKIVQVAASTLGVDDISLIKIKPSYSLIGANNSATGGSVGSELNCAAILSACQVLNDRMKAARAKLPATATWPRVVKQSQKMGINLTAEGCVDMASTHTFSYCTYGVTCTEVELDVLTGEHELIRTDMLYDCGESMNPEIDVGQAQGAFAMGIGYWLTEHFVRDPTTGTLLTSNTWEYKPPSSKDIPADFRIAFLKDAPNPLGILRSKAVGEPPICMSCSCLLALKHAIENARSEIQRNEHFSLNGPATVDVVQENCLVDPDQFSL
ncbi:xanthine dehydrogenase/oxidase-like [Oscarella lobularis]|uniref:xanthine dehydrogenase/oxidase-like n=1 Tax=Oscarella lobularis TaxID=121494 RepID=UPI0033143BDB